MDRNRTAEKAWVFFQANKTFSLTLFRIYMNMNVKEANRWCAAAVQCGMLISLGEHKFKSTGTYLNLGEYPISKVE